LQDELICYIQVNSTIISYIGTLFKVRVIQDLGYTGFGFIQGLV